MYITYTKIEFVPAPIGCHSNLLLTMTSKETEFFICATKLSNDHNKNSANLLSDTHLYKKKERKG